MGGKVIDIEITRGKSFAQAYRYAEEKPLIWRDIDAIPSFAPVRLTVASHGVPDGWPIGVKEVRNPSELNTTDFSYEATVIDPDTIELNTTEISGARQYVGAGRICYPKPFDLTGCSARMQIRDRIGGEVLLTFSSDLDSSPDGPIDIDVGFAALIVRLSPAATAAIVWSRGVYDLELTTPDGGVYPIALPSRVTVSPEVTR